MTSHHGAVGDQTPPAEAMGTGQDNWVVQHAQADSALIILQSFCWLLILFLKM